MTPLQFQAAVLDQITKADVVRAVADWLDGHRPHHTFRAARGWHLVVARERLAHRPIIAMAAARTYGRGLVPDDFNGSVDKMCKWWLETQRGFTTRDRQPASTLN